MFTIMGSSILGVIKIDECGEVAEFELSFEDGAGFDSIDLSVGILIN